MTQAFKAQQFAGYAGVPEHVAIVEPTPKEVRVVFAGETIARSRNVLIMHEIMRETKYLPVYYFPMNDVRMDLLEPLDRKTH